MRAMAPRPNPPARGAAPEAARRQDWVTRFWEELTPAQRRLVARRLRERRREPGLGVAEVEAAWEVMGLSDRKSLVQGRAAPVPSTPADGSGAAPPPRPSPAEAGEGEALPGRSAGPGAAR
ncbi:hypothetical protein [Roseicella aquatilis]|uniref:Uncharacterized protein n=1 Tax=Roseicella aquatilis TaxID=2527868 RepID=A0A4R4D5Y6_9PROT|nr:hypothetical protein [Roseicella aquatilis]TCZ55011.1 hypothetical protein EXY23_22705 [Roseicella aquatilis]